MGKTGDSYIIMTILKHMSIKYDPNVWPLGSSWVYPREQRSSQRLRIMVICAHPDDADLLTGGLTYKLTQRGHRVKYVAVTNGNA